MIIFITANDHRYTHRALAKERDVEVRVISHGELKARSANLPIATYVFTDVDRLAPEQRFHAARYYRALCKLGIRALNDPARMLSRVGLLRALYRAGINAFDAYRLEELSGPMRWPVFVRVDGSHSDPVSGLLNDQAELDAAIADCISRGIPRSLLMVIEYAAEPVIPGLYRKLSVFRVGDTMLGFTCVHDDKWLVKYGTPGIATPELYDEEYQLVADNPYLETMRTVFDIAGIDYGRVDFGLVDGRPQIYEINSNPDVKLRPKEGLVARREESNALFRENYLAALRTIDTPAVQARAAAEPEAATSR
ncbi:MAG: hypothetical protein ABIS38_05090 [Sphingomicrobium sp.]